MIDTKTVRKLLETDKIERVITSRTEEKDDLESDLLPHQEIDGISLRCFRVFHPEEYYYYIGEKKIGYSILMFGRFCVYYFLENDDFCLIMEVTYSHKPYKGRFNKNERIEMMTEAVQALKNAHTKINAEVKE